LLSPARSRPCEGGTWQKRLQHGAAADDDPKGVEPATGGTAASISRSFSWVSEDGLRFFIALLLALAAPLFGLLFACFFAWHAQGEGRPGVRNLMLAVAVLAAVPMITGVYLWGRFVAGL
jgi:hypothetical protein